MSYVAAQIPVQLVEPPAKPASCQTCVGWQWGQTGFMAEPEGPGAFWNGVLLVGEALGETEAAEGRPFAGRAGLALSQMLQRAGMPRAQFMIDNALRCRPPFNKLAGQSYERDAIAHCAPFLDETIRRHRPRAIAALGDVAMRRVLGLEHLAKGDTLTKRRGFPEWSDRYQVWVVPTFHPSYLARGNRHLTQVFTADIAKTVRIARGGWQPFTANLLSDPDVATVERYVTEFEQRLAAGEDLSLAYDIETPYKAEEDDEADLEVDDPTFVILRVGFSYESERAISLAWTSTYLPFIQRLLAAKCRKLTWNGRYDTPRLLANGMTIEGQEWDLMWAWHIWRSDLPKGLGFVASMLLPDCPRWKHLAGTDAGRYNALDAVITHKLYAPIINGLRQSDLWHVFDRHILQLDELLLAMSKRGVCIDTPAREVLAKDLTEADAAKIAEATALVPRVARRAKVFAGKPKSTTGLIKETHERNVLVCPNCGEQKPKKAHFEQKRKKVKECTACGELGVTAAHVKATKKQVNRCAGATIQTVEVVTDPNPCAGLAPEVRHLPLETWVRLEPWTPSNKQMTAYARALDHEPVVKRQRGEDPKITFDDDALKVMIRRYPEDKLYPLVREERELSTLASRYSGWWEDDHVEGGFPVGADGRVHTTFLHNPSTLRLSSQAPNLQNIPRPTQTSPWPKRIKDLFIPDAGCGFIELDFKAIEAQLVGYEARSWRYVRLAKLGVHDFLNSHILARAGKIAAPADTSWSDADLKAFFKDLKRRFPDERDIAKRIVHGSNYLMTPRRMWELYPEQFATLKAAAELQALYFEICPEVQTWQQQTIEVTDNGACLRNPYGYLHFFFHVKDWMKHDGRWVWKAGEDAKRAIAFMPQSTAAAIIKEAMLRLRMAELAQYLRLQVHDSLLLCAPLAELDSLWPRVKAIMEEPCERLPLSVFGQPGHLSIEVEVKVGAKPWGSLEEVA